MGAAEALGSGDVSLPKSVRDMLVRGRVSWLRNEDVVDLLHNYKQYKFRVSKEPPVKPPGARARPPALRKCRTTKLAVRPRTPPCAQLRAPARGRRHLPVQPQDGALLPQGRPQLAQEVRRQDRARDAREAEGAPPPPLLSELSSRLSRTSHVCNVQHESFPQALPLLPPLGLPRAAGQWLRPALRRRSSPSCADQLRAACACAPTGGRLARQRRQLPALSARRASACLVWQHLQLPALCALWARACLGRAGREQGRAELLLRARRGEGLAAGAPGAGRPAQPG